MATRAGFRLANRRRRLNRGCWGYVNMGQIGFKIRTTSYRIRKYMRACVLGNHERTIFHYCYWRQQTRALAYLLPCDMAFKCMMHGLRRARTVCTTALRNYRRAGMPLAIVGICPGREAVVTQARRGISWPVTCVPVTRYKVPQITA